MTTESVTASATRPEHAADEITLTAEECGWVRDALMIGLTSYGQLVQVLSKIEAFKNIHGHRPDWLDVRHPTGADDDVSRFATALTVLGAGAES